MEKQKQKENTHTHKLFPASCFHGRDYQAYYCSDDINK